MQSPEVMQRPHVPATRINDPVPEGRCVAADTVMQLVPHSLTMLAHVLEKNAQSLYSRLLFTWSPVPPCFLSGAGIYRYSP